MKNKVWSTSQKKPTSNYKIWQEPTDKFSKVLSKEANKIVLRKSNDNKPLETSEDRHEDNMKMDVRETQCIKNSADANSNYNTISLLCYLLRYKCSLTFLKQSNFILYYCFLMGWSSLCNKHVVQFKV